MFPEKLPFVRGLILFCILTNAHSLHVLSQPPLSEAGGLSVGGGHHLHHQTYHHQPASVYQSNQASNGHRALGHVALQQVEGARASGVGPEDHVDRSMDVDSNRLISNVNKISYSPLLMLPMRHQVPMPVHQQVYQHRANSGAAGIWLPFHYNRPEQNDNDDYELSAEEEQEALLADMVADSSRIANGPNHQSALFGEMHVLGNSRHRTPHFGTVATSIADATGGGVEDKENERHNHMAPKQVPYKHQEQFLKPKALHHLASAELKAVLESNEVPVKGDSLRQLKKRTEQEEHQSSGKSDSTSSEHGHEQNRRLSGEAESSAKDHDGQRIQVSKKSGNPFLGDSQASMMIPHSIASQLMLRSARGQRQYDVPQIGEFVFINSRVPIICRHWVPGCRGALEFTVFYGP